MKDCPLQILNCVLWAIYGLVINDPLIYAVNLFGLFAGIIQFVLLVMFWPGRTKKGITSSTGGDSWVNVTAVAMVTGSHLRPLPMRAIAS